MSNTDELRDLDRRVAEARGLWFSSPATFAEMCPRYSTDPVASRVLLDEMAADERSSPQNRC